MRVLQLDVPDADTEVAADRLWSAGARAVEEVVLGRGRTGLRSVLADADDVSSARLGELPSDWRIGWVEVADAPAETWREHARPIEVGDDLVLRPAWREPASGAPTEIVIEPGGSFGLGDHPTTRLSAAAAWRHTRPGDRVLDVGCGSGVLSIVAAKRGAGEIVAIDIAEAAVEATVDNARRNGVWEAISVSSRPIEHVDGAFDLVLANVLAPAIVAMADDLVRLLAPDGLLVVSGILADRHEHVLDALRPLRAVATSTLDAWAAVELRR